MPDPKSGPKSSIQPHVSLPFTAYPGHVFIWTAGGYYFLSAPDGGGHINNTAIQTEIHYAPGTILGDWLKFTLWSDSVGHFAFQTSGGNFITAVNGGGLSGNAIHTDATSIAAWEEFQVTATPVREFCLSIQTNSRNYLTAVGQGGQLTDAIHSNAVNVSTWEAFFLVKSGDLGSGLPYFIIPTIYGTPVVAINGGNLTQNTLGIYGLNNATNSIWAKFKLILQPNGSYGIQTANGHYLTAVNGGGLDYGTPTSDNIQTNRTLVEGLGAVQIC